MIELAENLDILASVLRRQAEEEQLNLDDLLTSYSDIRQRLKKGISLLCLDALRGSSEVIDAAKLRIELQIVKECDGVVPRSKIKIAGYTGVHGPLLQELLDHVGRPIVGERLRAITGEQVHTERRLRELRELGFVVLPVKLASQDAYVLRSLEQDLDIAIGYQLKRIVSNSNLLDAEVECLNRLAKTVADRRVREVSNYDNFA